MVAAKGKMDIIELLVNKGGEVNKADNHEYTALMNAAGNFWNNESDKMHVSIDL